MKYLIYLSIPFLLLSAGVQADGNKAVNSKCPQNISNLGNTHHCFLLRLGKEYYFGNNFKNETNKVIQLHDTNIKFTPDSIYNKGAGAIFSWVPSFKKTKKLLVPNDGKPVITSKETYKIIDRPYNDKRSFSNLVIGYNFKYSEFDTSKNIKVGLPSSHSSTAHYAITWCGDGIVDKEFGETCDEATSSCSTTCQKM